MTGVLLQVRLDSTRLPRKALLPLGGKTVFEQVLDSLSEIKADVRVLVTEEGSAEELKPLLRGSGFSLFVGSKNNVLERFIKGAEQFGVDTIVRATGDNPLVSAELANMLLAEYEAADPKPDYLAFNGPPIGTGVEIVKTSALKMAAAKTSEKYYLEHVCPYVYEHPEQFNVVRLVAPSLFRAPDEKVTLDTPDDYNKLTSIYDRLYKGTPISTKALVAYVQQQVSENIHTSERSC